MVLVVEFLRLFGWLNLLSVAVAFDALCSISFVISDDVIVNVHVNRHLDWLIKVAVPQNICFLVQTLLTLISMKPGMWILLSFCSENLMLARIDVVLERAAVFMLLEVVLVRIGCLSSITMLHAAGEHLFVHV